jgi:hypothetical protein
LIVPFLNALIIVVKEESVLKEYAIVNQVLAEPVARSTYAKKIAIIMVNALMVNAYAI